MSKMPIKWHERRLEGMKIYLQNLKEKREKDARKYESAIACDEAEINRLEIQIFNAKLRKLAGFDAERFLRERDGK